MSEIVDLATDPTLAEMVRRLEVAYRARPSLRLACAYLLLVVADNAPAERRSSRLAYKALRIRQRGMEGR
jgi:hypothetical protein